MHEDGALDDGFYVYYVHRDVSTRKIRRELKHYVVIITESKPHYS